MPQPFTLRVPDSDIADLRERLARTRFPDSAPGEPWLYGTDVDYLRSLVDYLARFLRLARAGGAPQRLPAIQGDATGLPTCTFCMSRERDPIRRRSC